MTDIIGSFNLDWLDLKHTYNLRMIAIDEDAIREAIYNLLVTTPGERWFNPALGNPVLKLLFHPLLTSMPQLLLNKLKQYFALWDPRIVINSATYSLDIPSSTVYLNFIFSWLTINNQLFTSTFNLTLSR